MLIKYLLFLKLLQHFSLTLPPSKFSQITLPALLQIRGHLFFTNCYCRQIFCEENSNRNDKSSRKHYNVINQNEVGSGKTKGSKHHHTCRIKQPYVQMIGHIQYIQIVYSCCIFKVRLIQMLFLIVVINCEIKIQEKRKA